MLSLCPPLTVGSLSEDDLDFLKPTDKVEIISESGTRVEQLQAAQLGAAASQLRSAAGEALTQPGGSRPEKPAGAAHQNSGVDVLDADLASDDPLEDEKLAAMPNQKLPRLNADDDSEVERDAESDEGSRSVEEGTHEADEDTQASQDRAASADKATLTYLEDDVAVSENADDLYPEGAEETLWSTLDSADAELELNGEPIEGMGLDGLPESQIVDSPDQDESYSREYYSRQQADEEDYDAEYADQQDDAEYADEAEDAEYAGPADDDGLQQDYTDLPEGSEAEEDVPDSSAEAEVVEGSGAADSVSGAARVEAGAQAETRSSDAEVAEGEESKEPGRRSSAGEGSGGDPSTLQEDEAAAADDPKDAAADPKDAAAAEEMFGSAGVDVGPMPEEGLEDEFSDPADLGLDELDLGEEFENEWDLQDAESEEEIDEGEDDLIEADPLEEGSADQ